MILKFDFIRLTGENFVLNLFPTTITASHFDNLLLHNHIGVTSIFQCRHVVLMPNCQVYNWGRDWNRTHGIHQCFVVDPLL